MCRELVDGLGDVGQGCTRLMSHLDLEPWQGGCSSWIGTSVGVEVGRGLVSAEQLGVCRC